MRLFSCFLGLLLGCSGEDREALEARADRIEIAVPLAKLSTDTLYEEMIRIAGEVPTKDLDEGVDCVEGGLANPAGPACKHMWETYEPRLKDFDRWYAKKSADLLRRLPIADLHTRVPFEAYPYVPDPNFRKMTFLGRLHLLRAARIRKKDPVGVIQNLVVVLAMANFTNTNPDFNSFMAALGLRRHVAYFLKNAPVAPKEAKALHTVFPDHALERRALRSLVGAQWLYVESEYKGGKMFTTEKREDYLSRILQNLGYLTPETVRLSAKRSLFATQRIIDRGPLTTKSFWDSKALEVTESPNFLTTLVGAGAPDYTSWLYVKIADGAETVDMLSVVAILDAIRAYQARLGHWPEKPDQLVPTFLAEWPKSFLNGKPIYWEPAKRKLELYSVYGDGFERNCPMFQSWSY